MFSTYVMAGGLVAAVFTDVLQGVMIIVLSTLLVPAGLRIVGGLGGLHEQLSPEKFSITGLSFRLSLLHGTSWVLETLTETAMRT